MKVYLVPGKGHTSSIKSKVSSKDQTYKNTALSKTTAFIIKEMLDVYRLINLLVAVCCHFTSALVSSSWLKRCSVFALSHTWHFEQVEVDVSHDVSCGIVGRPQAILQDVITGTVWPRQKLGHWKHPLAMREMFYHLYTIF